MTTVALLGAAGKIGLRIALRLGRSQDYRVLPVEQGEAALRRLRDHGLEPAEMAAAVRQADSVVFAIPDNRIAAVAPGVVPMVRPGGQVVILDPAAPYAGVLPERADISYFVTHPCHPPIFNDEREEEARRDHFGGVAAQNIICCLMQGDEADYERGEALARAMWAPVLRSHRVELEHMALLEPVLSETVAATCVTVIREAIEEAVRRGVPEEAARDFVLGHLNVEVAIVFGMIDAQFSDGALLAIEKAKRQLFRPDWRSVFEPSALAQSVGAIVEAGAPDGGAGDR